LAAASLAVETHGFAVSVIVPCFNRLEFTLHCLRTLFRHTRPESELIVVDNGSTDGTAAFLAGVQDAAPEPVTIIAYAHHRGFPAAINQGLDVANGDYLVVLNNDVVGTDGWLEQLIAPANTGGDLHKEAQEVQEGGGEGRNHESNQRHESDGEREEGRGKRI
jgi:glycosyltransferase involved in cell wall biosynthesis